MPALQRLLGHQWQTRPVWFGHRCGRWRGTFGSRLLRGRRAAPLNSSAMPETVRALTSFRPPRRPGPVDRCAWSRCRAWTASRRRTSPTATPSSRPRSPRASRSEAAVTAGLASLGRRPWGRSWRCRASARPRRRVRCRSTSGSRARTSLTSPGECWARKNCELPRLDPLMAGGTVT